MRTSLIVLLCVELIAAIALGQAGTMHRPEQDRAWFQWQQNPTDENRAAFEREKRVTEIYRWGFSGAAFAVLAGATLLIFWVRRDNATREPEPNPDDSGSV